MTARVVILLSASALALIAGGSTVDRVQISTLTQQVSGAVAAQGSVADLGADAHRTGLFITRAIAAASPGDTVRIPAGVYIESTLVIDRPLVLIGEGRPVVDGGTGDHELVRIVADSVEIRGFVFRHVARSFMQDRAAIHVEGRSGCRIADNRFDDTFFGVYLAGAKNCEIVGNDLVSYAKKETDGGNGIHSWHSQGLLIRDNRITGHRDGIYLEFTTDSVVEGNTSWRNLRYGLHFMFSDRCRYEDNRFHENSAGVAVMYAHGVEMRRNRFEKAWGPTAYGLLLKEIKEAIVEDNTFAGNSVALFVEGTDRSRFARNTFEDNGWAVKLMANATDNDFVGNTFMANTFDVATNSRTTYSRFDGNFWDRYRGYDLDRDGTGDVPFHPVRLFSLLVERNEPALVLLRSVLVDALDLAESVMPALTPETLVDKNPAFVRPAAAHPAAALPALARPSAGIAAGR